MRTLVFRSLPLYADSRILRVASLPGGEGIDTFTWEPDPEKVVGPEGVTMHTFPFSKSDKRFTALKFVFFCMWVGVMVIRWGRKGDIAVFMDLDTAFVGIVAAKLKGVKVVFDIVDPIAETKIRSATGKWLARKLEILVADQSDLVLVPLACRLSYYADFGVGVISNPKVLVVENVPAFDGISPVSSRKTSRGGECRHVTVGYFGTLDAEGRGLRALASLAISSAGRIKAVFAGQGGMTSELEGLAREHPQALSFLGPFYNQDLRRLYDMVDFTWAYYSAENPLHRYAAPNKYYEHLYFATPIITSTIIPQARSITECGSGIVVEGLDDVSLIILAERIASFDRGTDFSSNLSALWESCYRDYYPGVSKEAQRILMDGTGLEGMKAKRVEL